jgi:hypothetical protein
LLEALDEAGERPPARSLRRPRGGGRSLDAPWSTSSTPRRIFNIGWKLEPMRKMRMADKVTGARKSSGTEAARGDSHYRTAAESADPATSSVARPGTSSIMPGRSTTERLSIA